MNFGMVILLSCFFFLIWSSVYSQLILDLLSFRESVDTSTFQNFNYVTSPNEKNPSKL